MTQACNACGSSLIPHLFDIPHPVSDTAFALHRCDNCGLGHTVPQPENLDSYYDPAYYANRHGLASGFCARRRLGFLARATGGATGKRLLDVGCGDGTFLLAAKKAGWEVVGTEIRPDTARAAGLDVREEIGMASDCAPFDCITLWHSLEHMRDIQSTLTQLSGLLRPNGALLVAVPDLGGLQARLFGRKWLHLDIPRHLYHFDSASLSCCLERAGFAVRRKWHQELEYDLIGWSQSALNCLFDPPDLFLRQLSGNPVRTGPLRATASFALGSLLTVLSLPAVAAGTMLGRGGTLVALAHRTR